MISKYNHKELNWIDLESPRKEEIEHVIEQYPIPSTIKDKIISKITENEVLVNHDFIYFSVASKVIFFVNDNFVLTIHSDPVKAFNEFSKEMELDVVGGEKINSHKLLFAYLLKNLYMDSEKELFLNREDIKNLKNQIEKKNQKIKKIIISSVLLIIILIIFIWL